MLAVCPPDSSLEAGTNTVIRVQSDTSIDPDTVTDVSLVVHVGGEPVGGVTHLADEALTFVPAEPLPTGQTVHVEVDPGVLDIHGVSLASVMPGWSFESGDGPGPLGKIQMSGEIGIESSKSANGFSLGLDGEDTIVSWDFPWMIGVTRVARETGVVAAEAAMESDLDSIEYFDTRSVDGKVHFVWDESVSGGYHTTMTGRVGAALVTPSEGVQPLQTGPKVLGPGGLAVAGDGGSQPPCGPQVPRRPSAFRWTTARRSRLPLTSVASRPAPCPSSSAVASSWPASRATGDTTSC